MDLSATAPGSQSSQVEHRGWIEPEIECIPLSGRLAFGVVTTSRPTDTSINQLVEVVEPLPQASIPGPHENPTLLVILLTPGLARYALDSSLTDALYQRFKIDAKPGVTIETTSAIVDRLPAGSNEPEGSEGMAYMLFRDPSTTKSEDRTAFQQSAQKPGSLTFRMPRWVPHGGAPLMDYELQLPLSQTIFTTGSVSTLIHRTFAVETPSGSLSLSHEQKLESETLQLPAMPKKFDSQGFTVPLVPLTPFRRINYVMGNIIRKLSSQPAKVLKRVGNGKIDQAKSSGVAENDMPASQELEKSVSRYFEALDLQPETVSVWALVIPQNTNPPLLSGSLRGLCVRPLLKADDEFITSAWHPASKHATDAAKGISNALRILIPRGARLIKVLSGGGGWGKKAGLLSLDPDVQYSTRELRQDEGWTFDFDDVGDGTGAATEAQKNQALGQIVKEGESIMFLLAPKPEHLPQERGQASKSKYKKLPRTLEWTFGAIPSSIDMVPQNVTSDTNVATIHHYPGHFGMLSEGGMALTVNQVQGTVGQTKLDVPFGTFAIHHFDVNYFQLGSVAQHAELSAASSVAPQASTAQQTHSTAQAKQTTEPVQT